MAETDTVEYDSRYAARALALFSAFIIIAMYIDTMLVPSLPSIGAQYGINAAQTSLILAVYLVSGVALNPIVGKLGDIYGKKRVLNYVLPIYAVAVTITGFSPSFTFLIAARMVQGIGLTIMPLALSLVREQFPPERMPFAQGILSAMFGVGAAVGLPIGAFISDKYGWQATYHTAIPFVAAATVLIMAFIRESRYTRPAAKVDYRGALALALALGSAVFAISEGSYFGWASPAILASLGVAALASLSFLAVERRVEHPILDFGMLRARNILDSNLIVLVVGFGFFMAYQTYAYQFELPRPMGFGYDIFHTGLALVPFAAMNIVAAPIVGRLISMHGTKPYLLGGAALAAAGFLLSAHAPDPYSLMLAAAVVGIGVASLNVSLINVLVLSVDRKDMGMATSANTVFRFLGSAVGAPVAGVLIAEIATRLSFAYSFYIAAASFAAVFMVSLRVREVIGRRRAHHRAVFGVA